MKNRIRNAVSIVIVIVLALIIWKLAVNYFTANDDKWKYRAYFPPPDVVFQTMWEDRVNLIEHVKSSLGLIFNGYIRGLLLAVPLGLIIGYAKHIGTTLGTVSKFLGSIPPIVYIPYGIALLPTFEDSRIMVIFLATFFPVLAATISGVRYTEKKYVEMARIYGHSKISVLFRVVLPNALPHIFTGCNQGLSVSFILLTSAEMINSRAGIGYYVNYYSDLGNWTKTLVGVIIIGVVISLVFAIFQALQKYLLRWQS
ncbi:hypothetical protein FACS1894132_14250 [Clostridia bacterium]|nr:hypothetical protein FACS1894132_14250 [Clostridia bacterium]